MPLLLKNRETEVKNKENVHRHPEFCKNHDTFNSCLNSECIRCFLQTHCVLGLVVGAGDAEVMQVANCYF